MKTQQGQNNIEYSIFLVVLALGIAFTLVAIGTQIRDMTATPMTAISTK